jgi:hypothetical protein
MDVDRLFARDLPSRAKLHHLLDAYFNNVRQKHHHINTCSERINFAGAPHPRFRFCVSRSIYSFVLRVTYSSVVSYRHKPSFMRMLDESLVIDSANRALLHIMCAHAAKCRCCKSIFSVYG